ncbi:hypothetical protein MRB53_021134 [Persea americana]|uniref:Uncharacterized protein n=1 Tax=Persea americana TaxID=3435 RepID=A0ACC2L419_PERAE|nr:hypothetical protein MRB53_021134 [Persea americana]
MKPASADPTGPTTTTTVHNYKPLSFGVFRVAQLRTGGNDAALSRDFRACNVATTTVVCMFFSFSRTRWCNLS